MPLLAQVPLADDSACQGGMLVFAGIDGRLVHVTRRVGNLLAHDGDAVHGVTALVTGIRLAAALGAWGWQVLAALLAQPITSHLSFHIPRNKPLCPTFPIV